MKKFFLILSVVIIFSLCLTGCKKEEPQKTWSDDFDFLGNVYEYVKENYIVDVDADALDYAAAEAIINKLDPYSYITDNAISIVSDANLGAFFTVTKYNEYIVDHVVEGMPAARSFGDFTLKRGDSIYAVNGERVEGLARSEFSRLTIGGEGTELKLTIKREGVIVGEFSYTKVKDTMPNAYVEDIDPDVGYIRLISFSNGKTENGELLSVNSDFDECFKEIKESGKSSLVLDLRGNPGGSSLVLAHIASYFVPLDNGAPRDILCLEYAKTKQNIMVTVTEDNYSPMPLVILTNGSTASAAEALAGACRAFNPNATIVGTDTYGKGVFQASPHKISDHVKDSDETFDDTYYLVLVSGYYYIIDPSVEGGRYNIHSNPIKPDVKVEPNNEISSLDKDAEIIKALEILKADK